MSPRQGSSYVLRVIVVNAFLVVGLYEVYRNGKMSANMIALYAALFVIANTLMYFGARARQRMQNR